MPSDNIIIAGLVQASNQNIPAIIRATQSGGVYTLIVSGGSGGTVTDVSVVTANGVSGSVATSTTTPAITLTLGAITPASVHSTGLIRTDSYFQSGSVGILLPSNGYVWTGNGVVQIADGSFNPGRLLTGTFSASGPISIGSYTVATLPDEATSAGYYVDVSDAALGPGLARSNGVNWKIPNTNTTII